MQTLKLVAIASIMGLLAACASPSAIILNDGQEIQTRDTPRYDDESGFYEFEQIDGKTGRVNKDLVKGIREL